MRKQKKVCLIIVGIVRFFPASKVKMQAGWKDKWNGWLALGKPSSLGIGVPYSSFCSLISQKGITGFQDTYVFLRL